MANIKINKKYNKKWNFNFMMVQVASDTSTLLIMSGKGLLFILLPIFSTCLTCCQSKNFSIITSAVTRIHKRFHLSSVSVKADLFLPFNSTHIALEDTKFIHLEGPETPIL